MNPYNHNPFKTIPTRESRDARSEYQANREMARTIRESQNQRQQSNHKWSN